MKVFKHIAIWSIFVFCIIYFQRPNHNEVSLSFYIIIQSLLIAVTIVIFYLNYLINVPLLIHKKTIVFLLGILLLILLGNTLSSLVKYFNDWMMDKHAQSFNHRITNDAVDNTITTVVILLTSTGLRLIKQYNIDNIKRIELKEIAKVAELEALKAQINPHFLYNSFNSLYALAKMKSDNTADAILQLSDIMRYVTYKSSLKKVSIFEELDFIKNYIEFQKLRINDPKNKIKTDIKVPESDLMISPLILISFIENAFKHSNLVKSDAQITVNFEPTPSGFNYSVCNVIDSNRTTNSGVGLKTLQKILDFSYPENHIINLYTVGDVHHAELSLNLKS